MRCGQVSSRWGAALHDGQLSITVSDGDPRLVKLRGELDLATAGDLEQTLASSLGNVEIDCAGLEFIDSSGLHVLVDVHKALERRGHRLGLRNVGGPARPGPQGTPAPQAPRPRGPPSAPAAPPPPPTRAR